METSSEEYAAFVHDDAHYLTEWRNIKEFDISTFNYYAFFFGILWMLYRKMYMPAALLFFSILLTEEVAKFSSILFFHGVLFVAKIIALILKVILTVMVGRQANRIYLQDAERKINQIKELNMPEEEYYAKLHQKGGKSWVSVAVVLLLLLGDYIYENRNGEVKASRQIHGPIGITPIWQKY